MKLLNFIDSFFCTTSTNKKGDNEQQENIVKLLQWGNYSEVNHNSSMHFKK